MSEQALALAASFRQVLAEHENGALGGIDLADALVAAAGVTPQGPMEDHYIELVVEDNEVRTRLMCKAAETASCRMRPDGWEAMESWTEEECTTSGHPCWAVKFVKDGGDEQLYGTDQILGRVPVTVEYADGVEVCAAQIAAPVQVVESTLPTVTRVTLAARPSARSAEHWDYEGVELAVQDDGRTLKILPMKGDTQ